MEKPERTVRDYFSYLSLCYPDSGQPIIWTGRPAGSRPPGPDSLMMLADIDGVQMSQAWLRRSVARVALAKGLERDAVFGMPISEFAQEVMALDGHTSKSAEVCPRTGGGKGKPATVNEKMAAELVSNGECIGWSATQWAEKLDCSPSTVKGTETWERIGQMRIAEKLGRRNRPR